MMRKHFDAIVVAPARRQRRGVHHGQSRSQGSAARARRIPGSKNVQGAILYADALEKIIPDFREDAPLERHVIEQRIWMMDERRTAGMHYRSAGERRHEYAALRTAGARRAARARFRSRRACRSTPDAPGRTDARLREDPSGRCPDANAQRALGAALGPPARRGALRHLAARGLGGAASAVVLHRRPPVPEVPRPASRDRRHHRTRAGHPDPRARRDADRGPTARTRARPERRARR